MTFEGFHGVFPYLVSPIDDNGRVMADVLGDLVEYLIAAGVHGLTPLGSTGEFAYLDAAQRARIIEVTIEAAAGRVPVVAGVAATTTADAVRQARAYEAKGVDGIVAILETYFPVPEEAVVHHFRTVAESVGCPIVLYTNPEFQRSDLSIAAIECLAHVPNIRYVKDASGKTGRLLSILNRVGDRIAVFAASAHIPAAVMMIGGVGWMAGPACLVPRASVRLYELCRSGAWTDAMALQRRLWPLHEAFARHALAACVKGGLEELGFLVGAPLPPQQRLSAVGRAEIRAAIAGIEEGQQR